MLIKLIPAPPHPTVLFTLAFPPVPDNLPLPVAYHQLLQTLQSSTPALDIPNSLQALDRATWMVECLAEVIVDLGNETVRCIWVDEAIDEWHLTSNVDQATYEEFVRMLQSVLQDVDMSAEEGERERMREEWEVRYHAMAQAHAEAQKAHAEAQTQAALKAASAPPPTRPKHKKQRSLLMTLVASLVPSLSPPSLCHSLPLVSEDRLDRPRPLAPLAVFKPPPAPPAAPHPNMSSRYLRRRARSTLVDIWRRFILGELRSRVSFYPGLNSMPRALTFPGQTAGPVSYDARTYTYGGIQSGGGGGYHPWIARSMLRRAQAHMAWLVHENGAIPDLGILDEIERNEMRRPKRVQRVPSNSPFFDDDEDDDDSWGHDGLEQEGTDAKSLLTDTDGSSVHTPSESPLSTTVSPFPHGPINSKPLPANITLLRTYKALTSHALHLSSHIARLTTLCARARTEEVRSLSVAEVKARRRAWSNGALLGGSSVSAGPGGYGSVFRTSPLKWGCVSAADLEAGWEDFWEGDSGDATITDVSMAVNVSARLFPVSEENENEDDGTDAFPLGHHDDSHIDAELYADVDLEAGLMGLAISPSVPTPVRHHARTRTKSMYAARPAPLLLHQPLPTASVPPTWSDAMPSRPSMTRSCEDLNNVLEYASSRRSTDELRDEERRMRERALFEFDCDHDSECDGSSILLPDMGIEEEWDEDINPGSADHALARMKGVEGAVLKESTRANGLSFAMVHGGEEAAVGEWLPGVVVDCR